MNFTSETHEPTSAPSQFVAEEENLKEDMTYVAIVCLLVFMLAVCGTMFFEKKQQTEEQIQRIRLIMHSLVTRPVGKDGPARENDRKQQHRDSTESETSTDDEHSHSDVENPVVAIDGSHHHHRISAIQRLKQITFKASPNRTNKDKEDHHSGNSEEDICPICIMPFQEGDEACWSKNAECDHVFHTKCLKPWLMAHRECPCCRKDYLSSGQNKDNQEKKKKDENAPSDLENANVI